jgi:hypothetical protein
MPAGAVIRITKARGAQVTSSQKRSTDAPIVYGIEGDGTDAITQELLGSPPMQA